MPSKSTPVPSPSLSKPEVELLRHFRSTDAEVQKMLIGLTEQMAIAHPAKARPQLRLVGSALAQGGRHA